MDLTCLEDIKIPYGADAAWPMFIHDSVIIKL